MTTTTEELTDEQRTEVRRTLLQSIGEIGRGLELAKLMLKQGKFSSAKDVIAGTEAMLVLHEGMANLLLAENSRLRKQMADALENMEARSAAFDQTSQRMLEDGLKPKAERSPDYDHEVTMRYSNYAAANRTSLTVLKDLLKP
jgi:DNA phosphorothioation-dependent restriction protein DptG